MVPENMASQTKLCLVLKPHPSYPVNNVSQNFLSNEHLTCQHCNKTYKTETGLNRHKAKCKERDKPSVNNEHNIPSTTPWTQDVN